MKKLLFLMYLELMLSMSFLHAQNIINPIVVSTTCGDLDKMP